jgi:hypothetical protein
MSPAVSASTAVVPPQHRRTSAASKPLASTRKIVHRERSLDLDDVFNDDDDNDHSEVSNSKHNAVRGTSRATGASNGRLRGNVRRIGTSGNVATNKVDRHSNDKDETEKKGLDKDDSTSTANDESSNTNTTEQQEQEQQRARRTKPAAPRRTFKNSTAGGGIHVAATGLAADATVPAEVTSSSAADETTTKRRRSSHHRRTASETPDNTTNKPMQSAKRTNSHRPTTSTTTTSSSRVKSSRDGTDDKRKLATDDDKRKATDDEKRRSSVSRKQQHPSDNNNSSSSDLRSRTSRKLIQTKSSSGQPTSSLSPSISSISSTNGSNHSRTSLKGRNRHHRTTTKKNRESSNDSSNSHSDDDVLLQFDPDKINHVRAATTSNITSDPDDDGARSKMAALSLTKTNSKQKGSSRRLTTITKKERSRDEPRTVDETAPSQDALPKPVPYMRPKAKKAEYDDLAATTKNIKVDITGRGVNSDDANASFADFGASSFGDAFAVNPNDLNNSSQGVGMAAFDNAFGDDSETKQKQKKTVAKKKTDNAADKGLKKRKDELSLPKQSLAKASQVDDDAQSTGEYSLDNNVSAVASKNKGRFTPKSPPVTRSPNKRFGLPGRSKSHFIERPKNGTTPTVSLTGASAPAQQFDASTKASKSARKDNDDDADDSSASGPKEQAVTLPASPAKKSGKEAPLKRGIGIGRFFSARETAPRKDDDDDDDKSVVSQFFKRRPKLTHMMLGDDDSADGSFQ